MSTYKTFLLVILAITFSHTSIAKYDVECKMTPKIEAMADHMTKNVLPKWKKEIDQAAGKDLKIEWEWKGIGCCMHKNVTMGSPKKAAEGNAAIVYLDGLIDGLERTVKSLGDAGKKEIKNHVKKVVFKCSGNNAADSKKITCGKGVLTYDHSGYNNVGSTDSRKKWRRQMHDNDKRAKKVQKIISDGDCR